MRLAPWSHIEGFRFPSPTHGGPPGAPYGAFEVPHRPTATVLRIIASSGDETGWEHVSVSTARRTPNWAEMEFACRLFWHEEEAVMQLHPPRSQWVSNHPHVLHLWRPTRADIPLPPQIMVGVPGLEKQFDMTDPRDAQLARAAALIIATGGDR